MRRPVASDGSPDEVISYYLKDASNNGGWNANVDYEPFKSMAFGGSLSSPPLASDNSGGLSFGIVGTENFIFTTKDGGEHWHKKLQYDISKQIINSSLKPYAARGTTGTYVDKGINDIGTYDISSFKSPLNR